MVFSSIEFLLGFLPIFLVIYYLTPVKGKNIVLFLGSLFFYAYGEPKYVLLLLISIVLNYFCGRVLAPEGKIKKPFRQICFIGILSLNVGMLALFKWAPEGWALPLGVSFYTFQIISYLADVYRGEIKACGRTYCKLRRSVRRVKRPQSFYRRSGCRLKDLCLGIDDEGAHSGQAVNSVE